MRRYNQVHVSEVRDLAERGAVFIDVRERMEEISKDVPVYVHCRSGQRSYNAMMSLQNSGYEYVVNVSDLF